MSMDGSLLFKPFAIGSLTLPGRIYKAATSETRASEDGYVTDELIAFYEPIAKGGTPLIISGNMHVSYDGKSTHRMCGIENDDKIPGLKRLADAVHIHGAKMFIQLNHVGRQMIPHVVGLKHAIAPSRVRELSQGTLPRAMTTDEIHRVVNDFANAAKRAKDAGFDGVQIHAAHGYLINQFLTPYTNRRTDNYGGSFENRLRFLKEILHAIHSKVGSSFPVIMKINGTDFLPLHRGLKNADLVKIAKAMEIEGIDAVEISISHYESGFLVFRGKFYRFFQGLTKTGLVDALPFFRRWIIRLFWRLFAFILNIVCFHYEGYNTKYAKNFTRQLNIPVLCVGGFQKKHSMENALNNNLCDAITCARSFIADPYLYRHLQSGSPGPQCVFCNACVGRVGAMPVDCYHPKVSAEKNAMLASEQP